MDVKVVACSKSYVALGNQTRIDRQYRTIKLVAQRKPFRSLSAWPNIEGLHACLKNASAVLVLYIVLCAT